MDRNQQMDPQARKQQQEKLFNDLKKFLIWEARGKGEEFFGYHTAIDDGLNCAMLWDTDGVLSTDKVSKELEQDGYDEGYVLPPSKSYILFDPQVLDGTKKPENGEYVYSGPISGFDYSSSVVNINFEQLTDHIAEGKFQKPEKPNLGFWGTLRNTFSFVFGKPEAQKEYEYERDVYRALTYEILEEGGVKNISYDKTLLDSEKAQSVIDKITIDKKYKRPQKVEEAKEAEKKAEAVNEKRKAPTTKEMTDKSIDDTLDYFRENGTEKVFQGANLIGNYIKTHNDNISEALTKYLMSAECIREGETDTPEAEKYINNISAICSNVASATDSLGNVAAFKDSMKRNIEAYIPNENEKATEYNQQSLGGR